MLGRQTELAPQLRITRPTIKLATNAPRRVSVVLQTPMNISIPAVPARVGEESQTAESSVTSLSCSSSTCNELARVPAATSRWRRQLHLGFLRLMLGANRSQPRYGIPCALRTVSNQRIPPCASGAGASDLVLLHLDGASMNAIVLKMPQSGSDALSPAGVGCQDYVGKLFCHLEALILLLCSFNLKT